MTTGNHCENLVLRRAANSGERTAAQGVCNDILKAMKLSVTEANHR